MGAESVQSETERARSGGARGDRGEGAVGAEGAALSGPHLQLLTTLSKPIFDFQNHKHIPRTLFRSLVFVRLLALARAPPRPVSVTQLTHSKAVIRKKCLPIQDSALP